MKKSLWSVDEAERNKIRLLHKKGLNTAELSERFGLGFQSIEYVLYSKRQRDFSNNKARGERHSMAKLTNKLVLEIREKHSNGARVIDLHKEYGVSYCTMEYVVKRYSWTHI